MLKKENEFIALKVWQSFLKDEWPVYLIGTFAVLACTFSQVLSAKIIGWIIDFLGGNDLPAFLERETRSEILKILFLFLLGARLILFFGRIGWRLTFVRKGHLAGNILRKGIWRNASLLYKRDLNENFTRGQLLNISNSDVNTAKFIFGASLVGIADVLFLGIITIWAIFKISPSLTLICFVSMFFIPIIIKRLTDREVGLFRAAQEFLSKFDDISSQVVSSIRLQRLTQTGQIWEKKLIDTADKYRLKRLSAIFTSLKFIPAMGAGSIISYIVLFYFGTQLVMNGDITVGDFVALQGLIFLLQEPLMEMGFAISDWKKGMTSLQRIGEIFNHPKNETLFLTSFKKENEKEEALLNASEITFKFHDANQNLFEKIDFNIQKGERIGITGEIGMGKTTFLHVLAGIERNLEAGSVKFKGSAYDLYSHGELRKQVGFVLQRPFLFADTIRENMIIDNYMNDDEIWHFLKMAAVDEDIKSFPDGLNTSLGEWGINLSGGQKQRISLARTLARKPELLFLDDCLSAVDTLTEEKILERIDMEMKETALVWVAHRESTLRYCDKVITLGK